MKVPVRPIPALQCTITGPALETECCLVLTSWRKFKTQPGSAGTPWSGQAYKSGRFIVITFKRSFKILTKRFETHLKMILVDWSFFVIFGRNKLSQSVICSNHIIHTFKCYFPKLFGLIFIWPITGTLRLLKNKENSNKGDIDNKKSLLSHLSPFNFLCGHYYHSAILLPNLEKKIQYTLSQLCYTTEL